jgi:hypothetical protein
MRTIKLCVLAFAAVLAFSAVSATGASAAEEILFKAGAIGATFKSEGGKSELQAGGGLAITCESVKNNGVITDQHLGEVTITFGTKCKENLGGECTLGAVKGSITLKELIWHLGLADPGHLPAILILVPGTLKISCTFGNIEVKGNVIGLLEKVGGGAVKPGEALKEAVLNFKATGGKQEKTEFLLSLAAKELMTKQNLEANVLGGGFKEAGEVSTDTLKEFSTGTVEIEEQ